MGPDATGQITAALLNRWNGGSQEALQALVSCFYGELRRGAGGYPRRERADHTPQSTGLVHEGYLRVFQANRFQRESRSQYFRAVARPMRQIPAACKRWGGHQRVDLDDVTVMADERAPQLVALDDALSELELLNPWQSQVVELMWFAGFARAPEGKE